MPDHSIPKSRRRLRRMSARGLTVGVLLIGTGLGWLVRSARFQREAVAVIASAGGVKYNWGWTDGDYNPGVTPSNPGWLADLIGGDFRLRHPCQALLVLIGNR
jgi:hypothetical protein